MRLIEREIPDLDGFYSYWLENDGIDIKCFKCHEIVNKGWIVQQKKTAVCERCVEKDKFIFAHIQDMAWKKFEVKKC